MGFPAMVLRNQILERREMIWSFARWN